MRLFADGWSEGYDGPGQRWVLYCKGCNLRCRWCANPEGLSARPEILFYPQRGEAPERACAHGAVQGARLAHSTCAACPDQACMTVWKHPAFLPTCVETSVEGIVQRARQARPLFGTDGGVTFGGGEPTLQIDDLLAALAGLRNAGLHTAVESNAATDAFPRLLGVADLLLCDLKCADSERHRDWTGTDNLRILANLEQAARAQAPLWIRVPLVPGLNDDPAEMNRIAGILAGLAALHPDLRVDVLRLHHLGAPKYRALGMEYAMAGVTEPARETAAQFVARLRECGVEARGGVRTAK